MATTQTIENIPLPYVRMLKVQGRSCIYSKTCHTKTSTHDVFTLPNIEIDIVSNYNDLCRIVWRYSYGHQYRFPLGYLCLGSQAA